jgi:hypothetical protein
MQPQGGWKSVRLVKIEGFDYIPDVLPKLFPRITFDHDGLGQTLSPIAAVGFLGYFEDEFSHAPKSKLLMPARQVQAWQMSATFPLVLFPLTAERHGLTHCSRASFAQAVNGASLTLHRPHLRIRAFCSP